MEILLLIVIGIVAALAFFRPAPQTQIVYVPIEVAEAPRGGLGCLPLIVVTFLVLLALGVIRF